MAQVTATPAAGRDEDADLLADSLAACGLEPVLAVWDDERVRWEDFDLAVVRSTWDYPPRRAEFLGWADRVDHCTALVNPPGLLRWSSDKRYLAELGGSGVPVVPTTFVSAGDDVDAAVPAAAHVVKPTVSAGSRDTFRVAAGSPALSGRHVRSILGSGRTAMVQPYLEWTDSYGETALVYIDGEFSHGVRKGPILRPGAGAVDDLFAAEDISPRRPSAAERSVGDRAISALALRRGSGVPPLYARVDLLPSPDGPLLLELELVEPSLFLRYDDSAAARLAHAIRRRLPSIA